MLEVNENASSETIQAAYKAVVKKYHPDLHKNVEKQIKDCNGLSLIPESV